VAEKRTGIRAILSDPRIYDVAQRCMGTTRSRRTLVGGYVRPTDGAKLLDIGCGTASIIEHLDGVTYTGFDPSPRYIDAARARYGDRGTFFVGRIGELSPADLATFDVVLAKGVVHHLDDRLARELFTLAAGVLDPGGRLVTFDGCYRSDQSRVARFLLSRDRGQNVRTACAYEALARTAFDDVAVSVRDDLLRIPYTHAILVCGKGAPHAR
jgi:SAM-dependent methyltransferase